jgi:hypothetical protein
MENTGKEDAVWDSRPYSSGGRAGVSHKYVSASLVNTRPAHVLVHIYPVHIIRHVLANQISLPKRLTIWNNNLCILTTETSSTTVQDQKNAVAHKLSRSSTYSNC